MEKSFDDDYGRTGKVGEPEAPAEPISPRKRPHDDILAVVDETAKQVQRIRRFLAGLQSQNVTDE